MGANDFGYLQKLNVGNFQPPIPVYFQPLVLTKFSVLQDIPKAIGSHWLLLSCKLKCASLLIQGLPTCLLSSTFTIPTNFLSPDCDLAYPTRTSGDSRLKSAMRTYPSNPGFCPRARSCHAPRRVWTTACKQSKTTNRESKSFLRHRTFFNKCTRLKLR